MSRHAKDETTHIRHSLAHMMSMSLQPQGAVAAFIRRAVAGDRTYEAMHFLFNTNNYGLHGATLGNVWLPWVTRGVFIGQRRMILSAQAC